ncbi:hypothetical protein G7054_g11123 [Neopestalotiopsis clavispora]|nr:hypothetical protein G7054_g11123 [Neopestalotiopsis clavispora]
MYLLLLQAWLASLLVGLATAHFVNNLNYASPSRQHRELGVNITYVSSRSLKRSNTPYQPEQLNFTHGVASGDPWPQSVILWTRVAPSLASDKSNVTVVGAVPLYSHDTETYIKLDRNPICVEWSIFPPGKHAPSEQVAGGKAYTTSDIDFTLKIEATGLQPLTNYEYQFTVCDSDLKSPIGQTKTAPAPDAHVDELSLAVFSCANYPLGYFNVYGNAARKGGLDYLIHLGDFYYSYGYGGERADDPPREIFTLHEYRTRHGKYRTDADLRLLSQGYPWIATWDDNDIGNNGYRDGYSKLKNTEDSFLNDGPGVSVDQKRMNAVRAYFEWMPVRQVDMDDNLRIWRTFQMGRLLDLVMLDTRYYDRSISITDLNDGYIARIKDDASRTMMGSRQENWFYRQLTESRDRGTTWRIIGNQVIFSHIIESFGINGDNWNGYTANRNRTLKHLYENHINNTVFLAGDSHQNWVSDLVWLDEKPYNSETGDGAIGVEFAGTAISSRGQSGPIAAARQESRNRVGNNTVLQWQEGYYRGYFLLKVKPDVLEAQFYGSPSVASRNGWDLPLANFTVHAGANRLARPVAGGYVEAGALRGGTTRPTNVTLNTETGKWDVIGFAEMHLNSTEV